MSLKLMAVDDDPDVLRSIKLMMEALGCEVLALTDSQEAARRVSAEKFDGVLLDLNMPELDGFELTSLVRRSSANRNVPVVILTGLDDVETMRKGFKVGATCFLGKPPSQERLYRLIKAMRGPMLTEKRRHVRLPFRTPVRCKIAALGDREFMSGSLTISEGGMSLSPSGGLDENNELEVSFAMPGTSKPVRARGRVVRKEPPDQIGVAFILLAAEGLEAIRRYVEGAVKL